MLFDMQKFVKKMRLLLGYSVSDFAAACKLSKPCYEISEQGKIRRFATSELIRIAAVLGTDLAGLYEGCRENKYFYDKSILNFLTKQMNAVSLENKDLMIELILYMAIKFNGIELNKIPVLFAFLDFTFVKLYNTRFLDLRYFKSTYFPLVPSLHSIIKTTILLSYAKIKDGKLYAQRTPINIRSTVNLEKNLSYDYSDIANYVSAKFQDIGMFQPIEYLLNNCFYNMGNDSSYKGYRPRNNNDNKLVETAL